jgi:hypothetical protein
MGREAKFDHVAVGSFTADFFAGPSPVMKAKAAFADSKTGCTYGWTSNETWSPHTLEKLRELRQSMEEDLAVIHFEDGGTAQVARTLEVPKAAPVHNGEGGIGEHATASKEPTPQV